MTDKNKKRQYGHLEADHNTSDHEEVSDNEDEMAYLEESSESEPELDCDIWDCDSKVLSNIGVTSNITGCHLMATCNNDPDINPKKKIKLHPNLNSNLTATSINDIQNSWGQNTPFSNENLEIITSPFKACIVKHLLDNVDLLDELRKDLYELYFNLRNMDLYEFFQSKDLQFLINSEKVKMIYEFLKNDVMKWVATITGYDLTHISATCSLYSNTDYLLVHDDQREDRMVAFILYLTDEFGWQKEDGGCLDLFSKDENGQPNEIMRCIVPANNQMVFFPVTNDSYHQVEEIISLNKYRLSINGWFHTKKPPVFEPPIYHPLEDGIYSRNYRRPKVVDINLESWINDDYLNAKAVHLIQKHIEENSEIALRSFFKKESFMEVFSNLQQSGMNWTKIGPINRYSYEIANLSSVPHVIERFLDLFQSTQMFDLLQRYTDLELGSEKASMKFELQRWTPGNYALLTEYDWKEKNELDLIMFFGCKNSSDLIGARTHYVTIEDEVQNALITIDPEENNLNIVYRDSARFTKYYSKQSKCKCFYTLICSYSE